MDYSSCGAHADMLGARFGVRAAEDGHLTLLRAHGCMAVESVAKCQPTQCKQKGGVQGPCIERGPCVNYLQDRALIKQNLGPTVVGGEKSWATIGESKRYVEGQPSRLSHFTVDW